MNALHEAFAKVANNQRTPACAAPPRVLTRITMAPRKPRARILPALGLLVFAGAALSNVALWLALRGAEFAAPAATARLSDTGTLVPLPRDVVVPLPMVPAVAAPALSAKATVNAAIAADPAIVLSAASLGLAPASGPPGDPPAGPSATAPQISVRDPGSVAAARLLEDARNLASAGDTKAAIVL